MTLINNLAHYLNSCSLPVKNYINDTGYTGVNKSDTEVKELTNRPKLMLGKATTVITRVLWPDLSATQTSRTQFQKQKLHRTSNWHGKSLEYRNEISNGISLKKTGTAEIRVRRRDNPVFDLNQRDRHHCGLMPSVAPF